MILGFTGTRKGMTPEQKLRFLDLIHALQPTEFHHGDCIGADVEAHDRVKVHLPKCHIVIHPPINKIYRAFRTGYTSRIPRPYFERNRDIVDASDHVIAASGSRIPLIRGGTWYTIRYALKKVTILWPDGSISKR